MSSCGIIEPHWFHFTTAHGHFISNCLQQQSLHRSFKMQFSSCMNLATAALAVCALVTSASAQISVTSPLDGSTKSMPIWMRANVSQCNGDSNLTLFGYSIDESPFLTPGKSNTTIDSIDYRLSSPGTYQVHSKAWSKSGQCTGVQSTVTVTGPTTTTARNPRVSARCP